MSRSSLLYIEGEGDFTEDQLWAFFISWSSHSQVFKISYDDEGGSKDNDSFFGYFELCSSGGVEEIAQMESLKEQLKNGLKMKEITMHCWSMHEDDAMNSIYPEDKTAPSEKIK